MARGRRILTEKEAVDIVRAFTEDLEPVASIATRTKYSRQGIYKLLRRYGVDIAGAVTIPVSCDCCGRPVEIKRCRFKHSKHHFCCNECYFAWIQAGAGRRTGPYLANRHGMRVARAKVSEVFDLQPKHIVHHEDRNQLNNNLKNLRVFACQGDHLKYHRGLDTLPIWDGSAQ